MRLWLSALLMVIGSMAMAAETACRADRIELRGDFGLAAFRIEVAQTPDERARGLMFREYMAPGAGMLFVFERTGPVAFWMENTLIPLDMIFVDEAGTVSHIHHNAIPHDRTPIPGGDAVRYVLEINGGMARALGIDVGAELRHPAILQKAAVWPC
ncbi:DUF192 domain-containing protein [Shimia sp. CNT1-13L.2]|uniref:DUF192 domain-containing protein n=1 Tax=Shimia sp. CNT1-13L.2 TaxID=2959663 RepID=UPI0020CEB1D7|nr:DUF192 domain-containing protein [Shimia sp. CNT1-13L.2]MCP9483086.1 DUF192 domain-containing protein [Shimia sp. CNT1-13L.2]